MPGSRYRKSSMSTLSWTSTNPEWGRNEIIREFGPTGLVQPLKRPTAMKNPARKKFEPMLSQYVDGELTPEERQQVEQHLAASKESADQVADFRAMSGLIRHATDMAADEIDWKEFS